MAMTGFGELMMLLLLFGLPALVVASVVVLVVVAVRRSGGGAVSNQRMARLERAWSGLGNIEARISGLETILLERSRHRDGFRQDL